MCRTKSILMIAAMSTLLLATAARAATITPTDILASNEAFTFPSAVEIIDGSGLTDVGLDGDAANDTHGRNAFGNQMWIGGSGIDGGEPEGAADEWLIFDLGGYYDITAVLVWNHNQTELTYRGVESMDILATASGNTVDDASGWDDLTSVTLDESGGLSSEPAQSRALSFSAVRFIRFENFDTFSTSGQPYADHVGLSEVRFVGTVAIPEPASLAVLGLCGLMLMRRRG